MRFYSVHSLQHRPRTSPHRLPGATRAHPIVDLVENKAAVVSIHERGRARHADSN
jgi:hypothetical protein